MRRSNAIVRFLAKTAALTLLPLSLTNLSYAQGQSHTATALPEQLKGDPAPDTEAAMGLLKRGRYEDAIRQAKLALGRDERYVPAMIVLAKAYYYQKKYELATSIIDIAKSVDPNNGEAYNLLGFIALTRDDRISATAAFKRATELKDNYGNAWNNLAAQYLFSKNYDGAVSAAERAVQLVPNFAKAHLNLGSAYRGKQRYADAEKEYRRALELDPGYTDAFFDLGVLFLDAKEYPGIDVVAKLNNAMNYFNRYKQAAGFRLVKDDPVENYISEARKGIDREQKKMERLKKQAERNQPKSPEEPSAKPASKAAAPAAEAAPSKPASGGDNAEATKAPSAAAKPASDGKPAPAAGAGKVEEK